MQLRLSIKAKTWFIMSFEGLNAVGPSIQYVRTTHWRGWEGCPALCVCMGARRNFSRGGQNHRHLKKSTRFRRAVQIIDHLSACRRRKRKFLRFFLLRHFRLEYRVSSESAEGASENFRVFCRMAAYDVIFSNSRGASAPFAPPLRAPMCVCQCIIAIVMP